MWIRFGGTGRRLLEEPFFQAPASMAGGQLQVSMQNRLGHAMPVQWTFYYASVPDPTLWLISSGSVQVVS